MENIVDIFRDVVEGLGCTIPITSVTDNNDGTWTLAVNRTKWVRPKSQSSLATKVTIDTVEYDVEDMTYNESITVATTDDLSAATELSIASPVYVNGTQLAVQNERKGEQYEWLQCPFVWLVEPFIANEDKSRLSTLASVPDLTILFLDNQNSNDWTTEDHYEKVIKPMDELAEAMAEKIISMRTVFQKITGWKVIRHAKFGKQAEQGHISSIINEKTSGVEVRMTVEILKDYCNC